MDSTMDTSAPRPDIPESQGPEETSMEGFTMVKNKRTRDQSPKTVSPLRKHPRPNGNPEPKQVSIRFKIRIIKTEGWASAFEIALALFKTHPHLELSQTINREGHTILSTVMEKTRDYVVSMTKLTGRTVKFELLEDGPPEKRYAIVGVPLEVEPDYFIGLHHITKAVRIVKAGTPTTCMVLTTTRPPPEKIRIGFGPHLNVRPYVPDPPQCYRCYRWGHVAKSCRYGPRCYHCGRGHKKTVPCPSKPLEPVCLNCRQKHATAYRGCPARMEQVTSAQLRLGVTPRPKPLPLATTPAIPNPWTRTAQPARATLPASMPTASHPWTKNVSQDYNLATDFPVLTSVTQATTPVSIQQPPTPPTNHPETNMASAVAAIMAHMSHIWSLMNKVTELIKILPDDLKKNAAVALKDVQQKTTEGTLLQTVLEKVKTPKQTPSPTPRRNTTPKTKAPSTHDQVSPSKTSPKPVKKPASKKSQQAPVSASSPGTSEGSMVEEACS